MNKHNESQPNNQEKKSVIYNGVELPRGEITDTAPKIESFSDYIEDDFSKKMQEMIATAWLLDEPVLLEGGTSLGKTTTVKKMCAELGYEVHYANLSGGTDNLDLIGKYGPNPNLGVNGDERKLIFLDGPVTSSLRQEKGKIKVLVLDEFNSARHGVLVRLHEILDAYKRNGEVVLTEDGAEHIQVNKGTLKIIALTNPAGHGYIDREPLDTALIRRFLYKRLPNELPKETLTILVDSLFGFCESIVEDKEQEIKSLPSRLPEQELANIPSMKEIATQFIAFHQTSKELVANKHIGKDQPQKFTYDDREEPRRVRDYIARFYRGDITETIQQALRFVYADKLLSQQDKQKLEEVIRKISYTPVSNPDRNGLGGEPVKKETTETTETTENKENKSPESVSDIKKKLKDLGSPATLDTSFEGGIISLNIDQTTLESLSTYEKAIQAYKEADNDSPSWIYDELKNIPYQSPTTSNLDVLVMNHGKTTPEQRDKLVEDMNKIGYRPLELSELIALGILKPEYNKRSEYLTTYKKYSLGGGSQVPSLRWRVDERLLSVRGVSGDWHERSRFLFVRK